MRGVVSALLLFLLAFVACAAARAAAPVPGAASTAGFVYNDPGYRGWPVSPVDEEHPVRAGFLDPRHGGYHGGIDITVRDDQPEAGAPAGRSHRVFAVDGGVVYYDAATPERSCGARVVSVGQFNYGHVDPTGVVEPGESLPPGGQIGWTCAGEWHVHLTEWQGQVRVNPLRPGGKLWPYTDTTPPVIHDVRFFQLPDWSIERDMPWAEDSALPTPGSILSGVVDLRASVSDPSSFGGWNATIALSRLRNDIAPYRLHLKVTRLTPRRTVINRDVFRADASLRSLPFGSLYAPGTAQAPAAQACLGSAAPCQGAYWYRAFATPRSRYWDTTRSPNGRYRIDLSAWDAWGNSSSRSVVVRLLND